MGHIIVGLEGFPEDIKCQVDEIERGIYGPRKKHANARKLEIYNFVITEDGIDDLWDRIHTGFVDYPNHVQNGGVNKAFDMLKQLLIRGFKLSTKKANPERIVNKLTTQGVHIIPFGIKEDDHQDIETESLRKGQELT